MPTINGDQSGYVIDLEAMARALLARGWVLREGSAPANDGELLSLVPGSRNRDHWEIRDGETDELVGESPETIQPLMMGALGVLLSDVLPNDEYKLIVRVIGRPGLE
jgi:hypothetical protein